jgi:hypothetical protein
VDVYSLKGCILAKLRAMFLGKSLPMPIILWQIKKYLSTMLILIFAATILGAEGLKNKIIAR